MAEMLGLGEKAAPDAPEASQDDSLPDLHCAICFEIYDDPVKWPAPECGHHFCRKCLAQMVTKGGVTSRSLCPICRAPTTFPILDSLWTIPTDKTLDESVEAEYPELHALRHVHTGVEAVTLTLTLAPFTSSSVCTT